MIAKLKEDAGMQSDKDCMAALEEMELLLKYCELYKVQDKVGNLIRLVLQDR